MATKQDYGTPWEFVHAVERRFGSLTCDLAASFENRKAPDCYTAADDALSKDWAQHYPIGNLWLNPPFADIDPWAEWCALMSPKRRGMILLLTPASIGSNWFAQHVNRKAMVLGLSPRLTFEGCEDPYPKDLMISIFSAGLCGFDVWRWK